MRGDERRRRENGQKEEAKRVNGISKEGRREVLSELKKRKKTKKLEKTSGEKIISRRQIAKNEDMRNVGKEYGTERKKRTINKK